MVQNRVNKKGQEKMKKTKGIDILRIWYEEGYEKAKIYHNIDPTSITVFNGKIYFAHPDCWQTNMISNRYCIPLDRLGEISTDPEWIKGYATVHTDCVNRGLCVTEVA